MSHNCKKATCATHKKSKNQGQRRMNEQERQEQERREQEESVYKGRRLEDERNGFVDMEIDKSVFDQNKRKKKRTF